MPIITVGEESERRVTPHVELNNPLSPHPTVVDVGIDSGTRLGTVLNTALLHRLVAFQKGDLHKNVSLSIGQPRDNSWYTLFHSRAFVDKKNAA